MYVGKPNHRLDSLVKFSAMSFWSIYAPQKEKYHKQSMSDNITLFGVISEKVWLFGMKTVMLIYYLSPNIFWNIITRQPEKNFKRYTALVGHGRESPRER